MCFEEKQGQKQAKTHFLTGKDPVQRSCTCRTLANECQRNTRSIDICTQVCAADVLLQIVYSHLNVLETRECTRLSCRDSSSLVRDNKLSLNCRAFT